jgi:hypothetical protein
MALPSRLDLRRASTDPADDSTSGRVAGRGVGRWLLIGIGWLVVVAAAFVLGYMLAQHDATQAMARIQALQTERDMLSEQLAAQRDARMKLERSHQIDVEAQRAAQSQILSLERDRMRLEQQLTQLRALIGSSGRGVVEVDDLVLRPLGGGQYHYRLTLGQLVPDFGQTGGEVVLSVVTSAGGERVTTPLIELSADGAGRHAFAFEHFQVVEGDFRLPDGAEPVELIIEIVPTDDTLMASQEVVLWEAALADDSAALLTPLPAGVKIATFPAAAHPPAQAAPRLANSDQPLPSAQ